MTNNHSSHSRPNFNLQGRERVGLVARKVAAKMLGAVLDEKKNLDVLIDQQHGDYAYNALIAKDRALIRAILMVSLRRKGQIDDALLRVLDRKTPKNATHLTHSLSVAAAQILFLDIPDSAAVNLAVTAIAEDRRTSRFSALANAVLRRLAREKEEILESQDAGLLCMPAWFFKRLKKSFGKDRAKAIADILIEEGALDITVKSDVERWAEKLSGIVLPTGSVRLKPQGAVSKMDGFDDGEWWVQDAAASLPARLLGNISTLKVADLCAAPGGKTAQLISAGADVTAVDISKRRIERLQENLDRLKMSADLIVADIMQWQPEPLFDAVLLDAPCSSTGTSRRHPDVLWTKSADDIAELAALQFQLWNRAIELTRPGGIIVFSNCSLDREEGEDLYARILKSRLDIEAMPITADEVDGIDGAVNGQGCLRTLPCHLPHKDLRLAGLDGFFAARLRRI